MNRQKIKTIISVALTITISLFTLEDMPVMNVEGVQANGKMIEVEGGGVDNIVEFKSNRESFLNAFEERLAQLEEEKRIEEERIKQEELERLRQEELKRIELEKEQIRKENVTVNLDNLLEKSYIKAEELYNVFIFLGKEEMAQMSWAIVAAEEETGINALFLSGIIAQESGWGTSYRAVNQNNVTGYAIYNSQSKGSYFDSKYDCIMETARWLKAEYLSPEGSHFYGYTSYHVNIDYCLTEDGSATDFNWSKSINNISKTIESIYKKYIK